MNINAVIMPVKYHLNFTRNGMTAGLDTLLICSSLSRA